MDAEEVKRRRSAYNTIPSSMYREAIVDILRAQEAVSPAGRKLLDAVERVKNQE
ncbi:MAG: hypothetical protein AAF360_00055 [Pseudomonadota bacterium]